MMWISLRRPSAISLLRDKRSSWGTPAKVASGSCRPSEDVDGSGHGGYASDSVGQEDCGDGIINIV
jgi:hypothetical protein